MRIARCGSSYRRLATHYRDDEREDVHYMLFRREPIMITAYKRAGGSSEYHPYTIVYILEEVDILPSIY